MKILQAKASDQHNVFINFSYFFIRSFALFICKVIKKELVKCVAISYKISAFAAAIYRLNILSRNHSANDLKNRGKNHCQKI